ncbi:DNA cytosine methyltransferase [Bacillus sp. CFBP9009]|uniref:DNA cytosine methyltransferase n=1 Tax=Peribacillus frigoritolerans TaxID=450367 RepID=UPI0021A983A6|nr:DNA cytosine methyltransferase [Peribacillus frigoritolerans]MCT4479099.1 DNA cytosine methyltransferase [Peribacillus frigoritolerans]
MVIIDLFSGAGGLSEGFHKEGYNIVAQVEKDSWACETLKTRTIFYELQKNNDLELYNKYVQGKKTYKNIESSRDEIFEKYDYLREKLSYEIINKKFGNPANDKEATSSRDIVQLINNSLNYHKVNSVNMIIGGPPCQAYSLVGRSRMGVNAEKDNRNFLFYYYLGIVKEYAPEMFIFENVPGILSAKKGEVFKAIQEEFDKIGYTIMSGEDSNHNKNIINFADYGVPQNRKRVLLFGFKNGRNLTYPNYSKFKVDWQHDLTTQNVISDLCKLNPGEGVDFGSLEYNLTNDLNRFQVSMRESSQVILNHKARPIQERDRQIYKIAIDKTKKGEKLKYPDLPANLKTHKNEKSFIDRFKVHGENEIPHTVVAHISKDGHYNIHYDLQQTRSLTVREVARIQTFPDNFFFEGPRTAQYVQVGNAVPPLMSEIVAKSIKYLQ